ncbi:MAG: sodium/solute symporter [Bacteroidetes bacterium]|nr:sodium/solute symporter [Bacteroidota bacterium]
MTVKIIVIALYALMIIIIGLMGLKKTKSFSDFFLGGGNIGPWMTAFSYGTAYFSAVLFIGFAGKIGWGFGYSGLWIALINGLVGVFTVWFLLGWKIKKMATEYQVSTISEYLEKRYNSPFFKLLSSIVIFVFMIPYSAAVFMGLSYLFTSNFDLPYVYALIFMGLFTAIYLVLGGYKSMALIDMIFGIIMVAGVIVLFASTLHKAGGIGQITLSLQEINPGLTRPVGPPGIWPLLSLILLTSLAPFAMPQLVQKFYAIRDRRSVKVGMFASTVFAFLIGGVAYFVGSTTRIFLTPETTPGAFNDGQPLFDRLMPELLANVIPESLSVVILLLILSASMSTLASLVLVSSSSVTKDLYHGFMNPAASDAKLTRLMRWTSAFFILLSVFLAYLNPDSIVAILGISWGAIGSFFLGPFIWGLFLPRANKVSALISGIAGLVLCLGLYISGMPSPEAGTVGMLASLALNPIVSFAKIKK